MKNSELRFLKTLTYYRYIREYKYFQNHVQIYYKSSRSSDNRSSDSRPEDLDI